MLGRPSLSAKHLYVDLFHHHQPSLSPPHTHHQTSLIPSVLFQTHNTISRTPPQTSLWSQASHFAHFDFIYKRKGLSSEVPYMSENLVNFIDVTGAYSRHERPPPQVWKTYASEKQLLKAVNMRFPFHLRKTLTLCILTFRNDSMHQPMSHCWTTPSNTSFRCSLLVISSLWQCNQFCLACMFLKMTTHWSSSG